MQLTLSLGILSNNPLLRHELEAFAESFSLDVLVSTSPGSWSRLEPQATMKVDCWLVDEDFFEEAFIEAQEALDDLDANVIYGLETFSTDKSARAHEQQVLIKKIISQRTDKPFKTLPDVWVLAASAGGPQAVKAFLDELPSDLPLILLYAQHVDEIGSKALASVLGRDAHLPIESLSGIHQLEPSVVYKVPVESSVNLFDDVCVPSEQPWQGEYTPSIDQLLRKVFQCFGRRANVIYFSGMGEDGADIAEEMAAKGCQVWAQSIQSSVSAVMPESVINKGVCAKIAAPNDLARLLVARTQLRCES